jgi:hypothetical protein
MILQVSKSYEVGKSHHGTGSCAVHSAIKLLPQEPAAKKEEVALITQAIQVKHLGQSLRRQT